MFRGVVRTARYARSWKSSANVSVRQINIRRDGLTVPATFVVPNGATGRLPGWIAIGGVSRKGRFHPQLVRFAEALASSGAAVIIPEVPEWRALNVTPRVTAPTIRGCVERLDTLPEVIPGRYGVIGFSFGAPGVAIAASSPELTESVSGIVLFGGYCSLKRTLTCQLTGRHEWSGVAYDLSPDPYGRWIVGSNHLTDVPGHEDDGDVALALHRLADAASGGRISAWEPHHDTMIRDLRGALPSRKHKVFDCLASTSSGSRPSDEECVALAIKLADACKRVEPLLEPVAALGSVRVPTQVIHGRGDRLVPFTESLRLMQGLPKDVQRGTTVTALLNHSKDQQVPSHLGRIRENAKLFKAMRRLVNTV